MTRVCNTIIAVALGALLAAAAAAQESVPTMGRSIATLARVPLADASVSRPILGEDVKDLSVGKVGERQGNHDRSMGEAAE